LHGTRSWSSVGSPRPASKCSTPPRTTPRRSASSSGSTARSKEWLADEGPAVDLAGLQTLLDRFREHSNLERPHQGIGDLTPVERYQLGFELIHGQRAPAAEPALDKQEPRYPPHSILRRLDSTGRIGFDAMYITAGRRWSGATLRVITLGELTHLYHGDELIRAFVPDRTAREQPLGRTQRTRAIPALR
jgi:hypothetical protein